MTNAIETLAATVADFSDDDLHRVVALATEELANRETGKEPFTVRIPTGRYNERRYSRPWIADASCRDFKFGDFLGEDGEEGELKLENVIPGEVICYGQKDRRKRSGSVKQYAVATPEGLYLISEAKADHVNSGDTIELPEITSYADAPGV